MGNQSAQDIFPLSYKTAAVSARTVDTIPGSGANSAYSYIGFQLYQPVNLYKMIGLRLHLKMTFKTGVPTAQQVVQKISLGTAVSGFPDTTTKFILPNYTAVSNALEFSVDLSKQLSATGDDTIWLFFPAALSNLGAGNLIITVLKADMLYQSIGVR